ncbi:thermonuclease family protein [Roseixanthobacter glucoisosaccharinicivorans]|uniref:thermonuclease family protein n=1 Tax=Roseixanthobacter glucoisosaccharinicivorans TaxID=3119923 RepID=UPI003729C99A
MVLSAASAHADGCPKLKAMTPPALESADAAPAAGRSQVGGASSADEGGQTTWQVVTGVRDGALVLSGGEMLVPRGVVLPTRLNPEAEIPALAEAATRAVLLGRTLQLAPGERDRHGRQIADALLLTPQGAVPLSRALLAAGAAYADPVAVPACADDLRAAEHEARATGVGLWASPAARLDAANIAAVADHVGLFTVVGGRVRAANEARGLLYLNFGPRWREDVTATLPASRAARMSRPGLAPAILPGTFVDVRGVVNQEGGPMLALRTAAALEIEEQVR